MRKLKNVSKKCMIAILTAAMMMSTVSTAIAVPVTVYATDNTGNISALMTPVDNNSGTIQMSLSTIETNQSGGTVRINGGTIGTNEAGGTVEMNYGGTITENSGNVHDNFGLIVTNQSGGLVETNNYNGGRITTNAGTVVDNAGIITDNSGTVTNGLSGVTGGTVTNNNSGGRVGGRGTVTNNKSGGVVIAGSTTNVTTNELGGEVAGNGTVTDNYGTVSGSGTVTNNKSGGQVTGNANVGTNEAGGTVGGTGGTVTDNYGSVTGNRTITNNYGSATNATIVNYFSGTVGNGVTITNNFSTNTGIQATNQYWAVSLTGTDNGTAEFSNAFENKNDNNYLSSTESGTIVITPNENYEIVDNGNGGNIATCQYTVQAVGGGASYNLIISNVRGTTAITLDQIGLIIRAVSQATGAPVNSVQIEGEATTDTRSDSNLATVLEFKNADQGVITLGDLIAMLSQLDLSSGAADLNFGTKTNISGDVMDYLCKNAKTTINCHFTHNGSEWTLIIPKIDTDSEEYKACMTKLAHEPGGTAGFIRISQLFASVGVQLSEGAK